MHALMLLAMLLSPANRATAPQNAVIVEPAVNMHSRPSADADVVSQAIFSTNVSILEQDGVWLKIRTPDDYTGWTRETALRRMRVYAQSGRVGTVESLFASLYQETDITKHQPVITIPFESRLEIAEDYSDPGGRWLKVRLPDDGTAWVQAGDVTLESPKDISIADLVTWSKRFLGLPYLWGGTSTYGYDCSGFTQMLLRRRGYAMPRDAGPQADWDGFKNVDADSLEAGDLLYFGSSPAKITHTGMYIGDGEFINATAWEHPVVQICNLRDEHWSKLLVAARRLK